MDLKNQIAVVTGGSRGLGLGLVEALVERGARVTVVARTASDLDRVSSRLGVSTPSPPTSPIVPKQGGFSMR